ncbi:hypothetical protein CYMTET_26513, partial [Cymbomonas tetramitiformis]
RAVSTTYFISFEVLLVFIILNLVLSVVVDAWMLIDEINKKVKLNKEKQRAESAIPGRESGTGESPPTYVVEGHRAELVLAMDQKQKQGNESVNIDELSSHTSIDLNEVAKRKAEREKINGLRRQSTMSDAKASGEHPQLMATSDVKAGIEHPQQRAMGDGRAAVSNQQTQDHGRSEATYVASGHKAELIMAMDRSRAFSNNDAQAQADADALFMDTSMLSDVTSINLEEVALKRALRRGDSSTGAGNRRFSDPASSTSAATSCVEVDFGIALEEPEATIENYTPKDRGYHVPLTFELPRVDEYSDREDQQAVGDEPEQDALLGGTKAKVSRDARSGTGRQATVRDEIAEEDEHTEKPSSSSVGIASGRAHSKISTVSTTEKWHFKSIAGSLAKLRRKSSSEYEEFPDF